MQRYLVKTGLMQVVVEAESAEDAVETARDQLCLELPRLWDVIRDLPNDRFVVELLGDQQRRTAPGAHERPPAPSQTDSVPSNPENDPQHEAA